MIDHNAKRIYVDFSGLATFDSCKEKNRLGYVEGWRAKQAKDSLTFGHAFHAAIEAYYDAHAGGFHYREELEDGRIVKRWQKFEEPKSPLAQAQAAFLQDMKIDGANLQVTLEGAERRSIERAMGMIDAYVTRWKNEPYENALDANGEPFTEVVFQYPLTRFEGYEVWYCGYIDRLMRNRTTGRHVIFETKTTTAGLSWYIEQRKPNHQITGYYPAAHNFFPDIVDTVWDCAFISSRKADMSRALKDDDRWMMYGVDIKTDFARQITQRSKTDITEFLFDVENKALDYCKWLTSGATRWPRTAPGACHSYGGCAFRQVCSLNGNDDYLNTFFERKKWEPYKTVSGLSLWED